MKKLIATTAALILTVGSASAGKPSGGNNNKPPAKPVGISVQQTPGQTITGVSGTKPGGFPKPITGLPISQPPVKQPVTKSPVYGFPQGGKLPQQHVNSHKQPWHNYHHKCGTVFGSGYCYQGKQHSHWTYNCYWPKYQCQTYWCPSTTCYYYWCEPKCCYYPISHIASAPPMQATPIVQNGPPPGIPTLPE